MRKLVLPGTRTDGERILLDAETSKYLLKVLRTPRGEKFEAADETGQDFLCELTGLSGRRAELRLTVLSHPAGRNSATESAIPMIGLVQALPKGSKLDLILRQAVEAGVTALFPLQTRNCVAREKGGDDSADKLDRRRKIVREAIQQSGSKVMTKVLPLSAVETLAARLAQEGFPPETSLYLICHELALGGKNLHEYCSGHEGPIVILVGPEGGFDPAETQVFLAMGFKPLHFGGAILRTETAAIYAVAAVKTIMAERGSWKPST
jgi:16S rRNA (uracil1498-N3)-methyltransferase